MLDSSDMKLGVLGVSIIALNVVYFFAVFQVRVFNSQPIPVFPFSCLFRTFPVIPPRLLAVTPRNLGYLGNGLICVMW